MKCKFCDFECKPFWTDKKGKVVSGIQQLRKHVLLVHSHTKEIKAMLKQKRIEELVDDWLAEEDGLENCSSFILEMEYQP